MTRIETILKIKEKRAMYIAKKRKRYLMDTEQQCCSQKNDPKTKPKYIDGHQKNQKRNQKRN